MARSAADAVLARIVNGQCGDEGVHCVVTLLSNEGLRRPEWASDAAVAQGRQLTAAQQVQVSDVLHANQRALRTH